MTPAFTAHMLTVACRASAQRRRRRRTAQRAVNDSEPSREREDRSGRIASQGAGRGAADISDSESDEEGFGRIKKGRGMRGGREGQGTAADSDSDGDEGSSGGAKKKSGRKTGRGAAAEMSSESEEDMAQRGNNSGSSRAGLRADADSTSDSEEGRVQRLGHIRGRRSLRRALVVSDSEDEVFLGRDTNENCKDRKQNLVDSGSEEDESWDTRGGVRAIRKALVVSDSEKECGTTSKARRKGGQRSLTGVSRSAAVSGESSAGGSHRKRKDKAAPAVIKDQVLEGAEDDEPCKICGSVDHPELTLLCDSCDGAYRECC